MKKKNNSIKLLTFMCFIVCMMCTIQTSPILAQETKNITFSKKLTREEAADFEEPDAFYEDEDGKRILSVEPAVLQYPSLNEVNYTAYGEITEEYHNELYGFLEFQQWLNDYKTGRPQRPYLCVKNGNTKTWNLDLTEYVRHQIHHPENHSNTHFTQSELRQSIEDMRGYIRTRAETEGIWDPILGDE